MIIGLRNKIYDFEELIGSLQRAAKGVAFLETEDDKEPRFVATAWMITDDLLVIPSFVTGRNTFTGKFICLFQDSMDAKNDIEAAATLLSPVPSSPNAERTPVLIRLEKSLPGRALALDLRSILEIDQVFLLHYVAGDKRLKTSIGQVIEKSGDIVRHSADTQPGSSGSPMISALGKVVGIHMASSRGAQSSSKQGDHNQGMPLDVVLLHLSKTKEWPEIIKFHQLADTSTANEPKEVKKRGTRAKNMPAAKKADTLFMDSALKWSMDKEELSNEEQERLRPVVIDASASRWTLNSSERQRIIREVGSRQMLQAQQLSFKLTDTGDKVIKDILKGPPYALEKIEDKELPYWLQAVRWFGPVIPELPSPELINRAFEKRKTRSRLTVLAGPKFTDRTKELEDISKWYNENDAGPLVIWGIGGMGKSALLSKFILGIPSDTLLLWLDFDRADLAPDDALSVLNTIIEQATTQLDSFVAPETKETDWKESAKKIGKSIAAVNDPSLPPIAILDGFEIAQHATKYNEIWSVLEKIMEGLPQLRVIVSGRAPVKSLKLNNREAKSFQLEGMKDPDAAAWLKDNGITDKKDIDRVVEIAKGVPLILKLASKLAGSGGKMKDLPDALPDYLVEGFLYQRILDRVVDPDLKPITSDILVIRNLHQRMIADIFHDRPVNNLSPEEIFSRLMKEMGLVSEADKQAGENLLVLTGETEVLHIRPEVRSATLRLLETENAKRVRDIDERAATWYEKEDLNDPKNLAELIYHYLRLGRIKDAEKIWKDDCISLLTDAEDDLPDTAIKEREWLLDRTKKERKLSEQDKWETGALNDIHGAISRGALHTIAGTLQKRKERTKGSPLLLYDAWVMRENNDLTAARQLMKELMTTYLPNETNTTNYNIVAAMLAYEQGDIVAADQLLSLIDRGITFDPENIVAMTPLIVRAARMRLFVNPELEIESFKIFTSLKTPIDISSYILPADILLPQLSEMTDRHSHGDSSFDSFFVPRDGPRRMEFLQSFDSYRRQMTNSSQDLPAGQFSSLLDLELNKIDRAKQLEMLSQPLNKSPKELLERILLLSQMKWNLASLDMFLAAATDLLTRSIPDRLGIYSVMGTLAALRGLPMSISLPYEKGYYSIDDLLTTLTQRIPAASLSVNPRQKAFVEAKEILRIDSDSDSFTKRALELIEKYLQIESKDRRLTLDMFPGTDRSELRSVLLYVLGPNPLEILCRRALAFPEEYVF